MNAYEKAIELYNSTLNEALTKSEFIKRLTELGINKDDAHIAYLKMQMTPKKDSKNDL